jgi:hypothetical protein
MVILVPDPFIITRSSSRKDANPLLTSTCNDCKSDLMLQGTHARDFIGSFSHFFGIIQ